MLLLWASYIPPSGGGEWMEWKPFQFPLDWRALDDEEFLVLMLAALAV